MSHHLTRTPDMPFDTGITHVTGALAAKGENPAHGNVARNVRPMPSDRIEAL